MLQSFWEIRIRNMDAEFPKEACDPVAKFGKTPMAMER